MNGDRVHLMQIFSNLLSNAIKYTQEGGEILLLAEECGSNSSVYAKYRFLVSDNGMGMSADFKNTIFDPFTRAENSLTSKIQGTGLGMAITRNLVEAMGGTIDVESEPGQGSCFEVLIDLKIAGDRSVSLSSQAETDEPDDNILQGMHFLCAEDNELNAEILMELLKIEGAECTICENGEKILEAFEQSVPGDYDMILMDVQMPVMNGYEAAKAIRSSSHELAKKIPIIAMTANAFSEDIQHSLAAGMNAHISKPVDIKTLEKTVTVEAASREEAEEKVRQAYYDSEYILDSENFTGVDFGMKAEREIVQGQKGLMDVLLVKPGMYPQTVQIGGDLADLQKAVGGDIEAVYPYNEPVALIVNDEGKLNGSELNRALRDDEGQIYDIVAGDFLVVGLGEENFASLSPELMEKFKKEFHQPEMFVRMGRSVMALPLPDDKVKAADDPLKAEFMPQKNNPDRDVL